MVSIFVGNMFLLFKDRDHTLPYIDKVDCEVRYVASVVNDAED